MSVAAADAIIVNVNQKQLLISVREAVVLPNPLESYF